MPACEMCGKEGKTILCKIEGVELNVCRNCSAFGTRVKRRIILKNKPVKKKLEREIIQVVRDDFHNIIREKRERLGLKQKEFAKFLAAKESLIHKMESGSYRPKTAHLQSEIFSR